MKATAAPGPFARVLRGVALTARGRPEGLALFDATPRGFLDSLAPLLALALAGSLATALHAGAAAGATNLAASLCGLLGQPVVSHALARAAGREARWLRYATAYNWCHWALPVLLFGEAAALLLLTPALDGLHVGPEAIGTGLVAALIGWWLWLHWFLARRALDLPRGRAAALVVAVNAVTAAILALPMLVG